MGFSVLSRWLVPLGRRCLRPSFGCSRPHSCRDGFPKPQEGQECHRTESFLGTLSPQPEQIWGVSRGLLPPPTDGTRCLPLQHRKARPHRRYRHTSGLSAQTFREPVGFLLPHAPHSIRRRAERSSACLQACAYFGAVGLVPGRGLKSGGTSFLIPSR